MKNRLLNLLLANKGRGSFKASTDANTIELYDIIVSSDAEAQWCGGVSLEAFSKALGAMNGDVHLRINSPGGDIFPALAMAQLIREYKGGKVIAHIDGYAASAASLLPLAASKTIMAPQSMIMIHCAWTLAVGNSEDFRNSAALLAKIDGQLADAYAAKGNKTSAEFSSLMAAETWFTPQEAQDVGLCDEIARGPAASASAAGALWDLSVFDRAPKLPAEIVAALAAAREAEAEAKHQKLIRTLRLRGVR